MDMRRALLHVESAGVGRPLVLLHGWALHGGLFAPLVAPLAATRRVHAVDLPGHGHSDALRPWTVDAVVAALDRAFAEVDEPLDVVGWSLGGLVALAWAHAAPARMRRLVLIGTTPKFVAGPDWPHAMARETLHRFADELRVAYEPTLRRFLALQVQGSEEGRATLARLRHALFAHGVPDAAVLGDALAALAAIDVRPLLPSIVRPSLVIAGDRDTLTPLPASQWLTAQLPDARLVTIPGAAHAPFLSHSAVVLAALREFLGDG